MNAIGRVVAVGVVFALALYAFANVEYLNKHLKKNTVEEVPKVCNTTNVDGKMVIICNK